MANLFEKPIAANPMSEFVGLPLDFISKTIDKKQANYDAAKADIEAQEESLLGLKFLPGDRERHMAIQSEWDAKLDKIIDDSGGDYSTIQGSLDRYKRGLNREIKFGELAAQQSAYNTAATMKTKIDQRALEGKLSAGGQAMFNSAMQSHKTTPLEGGGFSSFSGYTPSSIVDPLAYFKDEAKKINAQYDPNGNKLVSKDRILQDMGTALSSRPDLQKALLESYVAQGGDPNNPKAYQQFTQQLQDGVVSAVMYEETTKRTSDQDGTPGGTTLMDVQMPRVSGSGSYKGGSMSWAKGFADKNFGTANTDEFNKWEKTPEGQRMIAFIGTNSDTPYPTEYEDKVAWLDKNIQKPKTANVVIDSPTATDMAAVDHRGAPSYPDSALYDLEAGIKKSDDGSIFGKNDATGAVAKVTGRIASGGKYPPGSIMIVGADAKTYLQENNSQENLRSPKYNKWAATKSQFTNTGYEEDVQLRGGIPAEGSNDPVPAGTYNSTYYPGKGTVLSQKTSTGVEDKYIIFTDKDTQLTTIRKIDPKS